MIIACGTGKKKKTTEKERNPLPQLN